MASGNRVDQFGQFIYWDNRDVANEAATITLPAPASDRCWVIDDILFGYENTPVTTRALNIDLGTDQINDWTQEAGMKHSNSHGFVRGESGVAVTVTLEADNVGLGKLEVRARLEFAP